MYKICKVENCKRDAKARGYCPSHYLTRYNKKKKCSIDGCKKGHYAKGLCNSHYYLTYYYDVIKKSTSEIYQIRKNKLFEILGGRKCAICGFDDDRALTFDHKLNDGTFDRTQKGGIVKAWVNYIKNPDLAKEKLQVLCSNCNQIKRHVEGDFKIGRKHSKKSL